MNTLSAWSIFKFGSKAGVEEDLGLVLAAVFMLISTSLARLQVVSIKLSSFIRVGGLRLKIISCIEIMNMEAARIV